MKSGITKKDIKLILIVLAIFASRSSLVDHYRVPTGSMVPQVIPGDDLFVNKLQYDLQIPFTTISLFKTGEVKRGDIVVFNAPDTGQTYLKRVVGLPGDKVEVIEGKIKVNGKFLGGEDFPLPLNQELYYDETNGDHTYPIRRFLTKPDLAVFNIEVEQGSYLMIGDNRDNSFDGRFFGLVKHSAVKGKAYFVLWNFALKNPYYFILERTGTSLY